MKKVLSALCALAVITAMCGCSDNKKSKEESDSEISATETATTTEEETTEATTESDNHEKLIFTGSYNFDGLNFELCSDWYVNDTIKTLPFITLNGDERIDFQCLDLNSSPFKDDDGNEIKINSIDDYFNLEDGSVNKEIAEVVKFTNENGLDIVVIRRTDGEMYATYHVYYDNYLYCVDFMDVSLSENDINDFINTLSFDKSKVPAHEISLNETYENDFYTMKIPSDCEQTQAGTSKVIQVSDDVKLVLWGGETSLNYTNNEKFAMYWVNDCLENGEEADVVCYGNNYYAKVNKNSEGYIQYVCQNGDYVDFFEFYTDDENSAEPLIENILSSVNLKQPKIDGMAKLPQNTSPKDSANLTSTASEVIYNDNGITITYTGITQGKTKAEINLLIENNNDVSYTVQTRNLSVNGFMVSSFFSPTIAAGKKCNDEITIYNTELAENGIDAIESAEFYFHIFQTDDWSYNLDSDVITISAN